MKLVVQMPWEKNLSVNHMRFGPGGGYRKKPEVQAWMAELKDWVWLERRVYDGERRPMPPWPPPVALPVCVVIDFRWPNARRTDDHNYYKIVCDSVAAGLGIDDKDIRISTGTVEIDRDTPGFTITVSDA